jgi:hypothetical protein
MSTTATSCDAVSSEQQLSLSAEETVPAAFIPASSVDSSKQIILNCNKKYLKSHDWPLRLAELVSIYFLKKFWLVMSYKIYLQHCCSSHVRFAQVYCIFIGHFYYIF